MRSSAFSFGRALESVFVMDSCMLSLKSMSGPRSLKVGPLPW